MLDKQFVLYQFTIETVSKALQSQGGETPLYAATKNRHAGVVTEMLEYMNLETASVAARNGYDPLHVATEQGILVRNHS
ncbi:hypothetical protein DKX38_020909 [Salix brachista]|uniref:Uncharacterized protein n=1 Tax=Salix brachista TaxID=2182728 RepID=A0A5N5K734_9ROSI|nr:hypothetical protein DKX38_020909 [Salix brachista]